MPRPSPAAKTAAEPTPLQNHARWWKGTRLVGGGAAVGDVAIRLSGGFGAVEGLRSEGARSLVLDIRYNPGGLLEQGVAVADLFIDVTDIVLDSS